MDRSTDGSRTLTRRRLRLAAGLLALLLPAVALAQGGVLDRLKNIGNPFAANQEEFLDPDIAFVLSVEAAADGRGVFARFTIAPEYYLYADKYSFAAGDPAAVLGAPAIPAGPVKDDPYFGQVPIHTGDVEIYLPVQRPDGVRSVDLAIGYQGCAEGGICYPPITKTLPVSFAGDGGSAVSAAPLQTGLPDASAEDQVARLLADRGTAFVLLAFLGFGLLLALTPCIFPMVPILGGVIIGHGARITAWKGFSLALVYVLAMAAAYAAIGVVAGLFGQNLQALFQHPLVLIAFSLVFVLLALSMFGFFRLQLPHAWTDRIANMSMHQDRGTYHGAAAMGLLSALIVGPCIAPPLAGAFIYIGQTGDALLGGAALFVLALGMGLPLLAFGASAGKLLPRSGPWMVAVQRVGGVILLGVAIWLLERILPAPVTLLLWALLLIVSAIFMGALDSLEHMASGWRRLWKGLGLAMLIYGAALVLGAAGGGSDVLRPLAGSGLMAGAGGAPAEPLPFTPIKGPEGLTLALAEAREAGRPVMLDFYADWCIDCKRMHRDTFADGGVREALSGARLLLADVTANDAADRALLQSLGLYGPPAILFYGSDGLERRPLRLVGYVGPDDFRRHLELALVP